MIKISRLTLLCVVFAIALTVPVLADETTSYFESFENYSGGKLNDGVVDIGSWINGNWGQPNYLVPSDNEGNGGMNVLPAITGTTYTDLYVYAKYRFDTETTQGVHISFKFKSDEADSVKDTLIDIYPTTKAGGDGLNVFYIGTGGLYELVSGKKSGIVEYEKGRIYDIDLIVDISNMKFHAYIDGELKSTTTLPQSFSANGTNANVINLKDIRFRFGGLIDWLDDFKISKLSFGEFTAAAYVDDISTDVVNVDFNNSLSCKISEDNSDYSVVNLFTGETVGIEGIAVSRGVKDRLEIKLSEQVNAGDEYQVVLPPNFTDVMGNLLQKPILFSMEDNGLYVKKLRFNDYMDNEYSLINNPMPAKVNKITFELSEGIDETCLTDEYFILEKDTTDGREKLSYSVLPAEGNTVILDIDGYLYGDTDYVLTVSDDLYNTSHNINKGYEFTFSTSQGTFEIKNLDIINNGIPMKELSEVVPGTLDVRAELVKTLNEDRNLVLSYSSWSGRLMTDFNYININMPANKTEVVYTISINMEDIEDITSIKGFLWDNLTDINAMCSNTILD